MVVYQVYPRSFADSDGDGTGDLAGITSKLDHLEWLGVDALWLSPITPSPMADGGYDVSDLTGVHPDFGTLEDVRTLAAAARERGILLLLDVVPCHTSIEHPWFREEPGLYRWSPVDGPPNNWRGTFGGAAWSKDPGGRGWYGHTFYPEQPDLDWRNPEVGKRMGEALAFWRQQGAAGFRLDALQGILKDPQLRDDPLLRDTDLRVLPDGDAGYAELAHVRSSEQPDVAEALRQLRAGAGDDAFLVGEVFLPSERLGPYLEHLDATFCFELFFAGWDAAKLRDAIAGGVAAGGPAWVLSNHDFARLPDRFGPENVAAAQELLLSLPGAVFLYQGDELAQANGPGRGSRSGPQYDRAGRDPFRHPMAWTEQGPGHGFTTGEPWLPVTLPPAGSVERQREDPTSPLRRTRELIARRKELTGPVEELRADGDVLSFRRGTHQVEIDVR